ncbi:MAG: hypothetical protein ACYDC2_13125 [Solirubrobacteraceae bacterium]
MVRRMRASVTAARLAAALAVLVLLAGCGSQLKGGSTAHASTVAAAVPAGAGCGESVTAVLAAVLGRIYGEGLHSEKTAVLAATIDHSAALRAALEAGDAGAAQTAAHDLLASGRMTALALRDASGRQLVSAGIPSLAPVHGAIKGAGGRTVGSYVASVWSDEGFLAEGEGVAQGLLTIRRGGQTVAGAPGLPSGPLASSAVVTIQGKSYRYSSLAATEFPSGSPLEIYVLRPVSSIRPLCGSSSEQTVVNTLSEIAHLIYRAEGGARTLLQVRRVQHDPALLKAVAAGDSGAARRAVAALLNQHIVRLRVSGTHGLLADVGGPYVLAPVAAPLRQGRRRIGSFVLSIQDDEGYLRLARRLAGLKVLMYMGSTLVKNSLGSGAGGPGSVPASGSYVFAGRRYRVITIDAKAFPSGPLTIPVLIPIPYS